MKTLLIVLFTWLSPMPLDQSNIKDIVKHDIESGNIADLTSHFTDNVDITIEDSDAIYSRSQASMVLKKFFENNKVTSFSNEHTGNSSSDNQYIIGKMKTEQGTYRVTYFVTKSGDSFKIKQFNIESI